MNSSLSACTNSELKGLEAAVGRDLKERFKIKDELTVEQQEAFAHRQILTKAAEHNRSVTTQWVKTLCAYGKYSHARISSNHFLARDADYTIKRSSDALTNQGANVIIKIPETLSSSTVDDPIGDALFTSKSPHSQDSFQKACQWLRSLTHKVIWDTNKTIQFTATWRKIEFALDLPSIQEPAIVGNFFKPTVRLSLNLGRFVNRKWVWNDPTDAQTYSVPKEKDNSPTRFMITFYHKGVRQGRVQYVYSWTVPMSDPFLAKVVTSISPAPDVRTVYFLNTLELIEYLVLNFGSASSLEVQEMDCVKLTPLPTPSYLSQKTYTDGDKNRVITIVSPKAGGKSILAKRLKSSVRIIDSDYYGQWLEKYFDLTPSLIRPEETTCVPKSSAIKEAILSRSGDLYLNEEDIETGPSLFETLASNGSTAQEMMAFYNNVVFDPLCGFRVFSLIAQNAIRLEDDQLLVMMCHTYVESSLVLGVRTSFELIPLFDSASTIQVRKRMTQTSVQLMLFNMYSSYIGADSRAAIPTIVRALEEMIGDYVLPEDPELDGDLIQVPGDDEQDA